MPVPDVQRAAGAWGDVGSRPAKAAEARCAADEPAPPGFEDFVDPDDERWEVFVADDDQFDPQPEPGDFWGEIEDPAACATVALH